MQKGQKSKTSKEQLEALIISAIPLMKEEKSQLEKLLQEKLKTKITVKNRVDKTVIAGLYIRIKDQIFDATFRNKIKKLKESLLL